MRVRCPCLRSVLALRAVIAALALSAAAAGAAELAGFAVPERVRVGERELVLNGIGVRSASRFGLSARIYVAALYLETPARDAAQVLASSGPKQIKMKYLYGISAPDMQRAWEHSFTESCPERRCDAFEAQIAEFQRLVGAVEKGDLYDYTFLEDRVEIARPGSPAATLRGGGFARLLLSTWIGNAPPTEELKRGMLGDRG